MIFYTASIRVLKTLFFFTTTIACITNTAFACPACIGSVKKDSPPFFSDELYTAQTTQNQSHHRPQTHHSNLNRPRTVTHQQAQAQATSLVQATNAKKPSSQGVQ